MSDIATEPAPAAISLKSFNDFGVDPLICDALADAGITTPFPIQELTLPLALSGADLIGQARTGTGKTLGFGIPLLHRADVTSVKTQALVVVPTRELCLQVRDDLDRAGARKGVTVVAAYGGRSIEPQADAIAKGAPIVIGTPGRLLDLLRRGALDLSSVTGLVLDEADEMLDLGFLPDVEQLIQACASQRQTLLFSATMPSAVVALARRYMNKPTFLRADMEATETRVGPDTEQFFFSCHRMDKPAVLGRILQAPNRGLCVVFSRTKRMADVLAEELRAMGVKAAPIHSDLRQEARERALAKFRKGTIDVLVATEVAARGLDITDVTHVVNYDCPDDEKMYLHRIGRTGRAGAAGVAITFAVWNELARLEMIKRELAITTPTHEVFSTSPILDELFDLPPRDAISPRTEAEDVDDEDQEQDEVPQGEDTPARGRRRRRGGRGRSGTRTGSQAAAGDAQAAAGDAQPSEEGGPAAQDRATGAGRADEPSAAEREPASGDSEPVPEIRTRRRTRTVRRVAADESGADGAAGESGADGAAGTPRPARSGESRPARSGDRTRTPESGGRTRTRTRTGSGAASGSRSSSADASSGRSQRQEGEGSSRADSGGSSRGGSGKSSRTGSGGSSRTSSGGSRRGGSRSGSTGRTSSSSASGGRQRRPRREIDSDAARGSGKPSLARPFVITHLP